MSELTRDQFDEVMVPNYAPGKIIPVKGEGSRVWDQDGREYIDFAAGIAVTALGHAHPALVGALKEQGEKLWHLSNVMTNEPALALAKKLTEVTFADKVFFCNSGAEANEAALKLARRHAFLKAGEQKHEIISTYGSFHGRTLFTVSAGGQAKYKEGFEPTPGGISHVPYNDLEALKAQISANTAAVIVEPIQGEGGVTPAEKAFLEGARKLCDENDALLIFDEVQTGVGRTGYMYAHEYYGVTPDVLTTAKALGGGFPIGAMLCTDAVAPSLSFGTHGSTYGGNPLACAVGLAVLNEITKPGVLEGARAKGEKFRAGLDAINAKYGIFKEVRGLGLLIGIELVEEWHGRAKDILAAALENGLLTLVAGPNVLRFAPSLIIPDADIDAGLALLDEAIAKVVAG
ncbi:aspartate aminotransferase family protein [Reinekea marinisedimentorum]|uniref:Acetylornithine aminotransferase n=1 Tax=Reinekea marinisedimentorum TaxID=230495 RepID=A0A4R3I597_9GAMM|nr:aspartate aminotransferase family protein [Reinekea marinisedimentorum]TCS41133.1 acetylornithine/N-succinyldiaminopimelate aminotransferase [Reinekea marinisedimentorum]